MLGRQAGIVHHIPNQQGRKSPTIKSYISAINCLNYQMIPIDWVHPFKLADIKMIH